MPFRRSRENTRSKGNEIRWLKENELAKLASWVNTPPPTEASLRSLKQTIKLKMLTRGITFRHLGHTRRSYNKLVEQVQRAIRTGTDP